MNAASHAHPKPFRAWIAGGAPWIWLQAGAVSLGVLLVAGLLLLIAWRGLGYFWPADIHEWVLAKEGGGVRVVAGQLRRAESVPAQRLREAGHAVPGDATEVTRFLLRVGNRDLQSQDFLWILEPEILQRSRPQSLAVFERADWGAFIGRLVGLREDGRLLRVADPWDELQLRLERARELQAEADALDRKRIGRINQRLERLRLRERALDRAGREAPGKRAEIERERAALETDFQHAVEELETVYDELARDTVRVATAEGTEHEFPLSSVVSAYRPNAMGVGEKLERYRERLWAFLSESPRAGNTEGGIFPAIFGTVLMVLLMTVFVTPLGILAAVYLHEYARQGTLTRLVRIAVNNLAGVPSIVYGVFGLGFFIYFVGGGIDRFLFSDRLPQPTFGTGGLFWASLTLALLTLPVVIVSTEEGLARVPRALREGSLALGATRWETLWRTVLPMASPGIMTGVILAVARAAGEVAPLMLVGVVKLAPTLPIDGQFPFLHLERKFMHLGFHIYDLGFQSPNVEATRPLVYATALLLVLITVLLNFVAIMVRNRLSERYRSPEA
ncbi:MAG: phosphate ABC transporter permease PstA [Gammaproteobacteria bacterium]